MESRATAPAARLSDLPLEVVGIICGLLGLRDRTSLCITCRTFLQGLASNEDAWGTMNFNIRDPAFLSFLAYRKQGIRRMTLNFADAPEEEDVNIAAQLPACLEGSPLIHLDLCTVHLSGEGSMAVLQALGSCTALTSLALDRCGLFCLPAALEQLPALAELTLQSNELRAASWGRLQQLTALTLVDIGNCGLATLPAELAALPALAELNLAYNGFGEASWGCLRQLTALTLLNMACCDLAALPAELAALPRLVALILFGNEGLGAAAADVWAPLARCSALTSLNLGCIPFARLPLALSALAPHLVELDLQSIRQQSLWAGGGATLGPLSRLSQLTRLNLSKCLQDLPLPDVLYCMGTLQDLDLSANKFEGSKRALWPMCYLSALTRLSLRNCRVKDLPQAMSRLQALKNLDLGYNLDLTSDSWQHLCRLRALTRLNLEMCGLEHLPPELAELPSLAELILQLNLLLGQGADSATGLTTKWAPLEQLTALTHLDASTCGLHAVPAVLAALPGLRVLSLADNPGVGGGRVQALRPLVFVTALQHLDLSGCNLPRGLEVDAIPFPLHRLEGWAEPATASSVEEDEDYQDGGETDAEADWKVYAEPASEEDMGEEDEEEV